MQHVCRRKAQHAWRCQGAGPTLRNTCLGHVEVDCVILRLHTVHLRCLGHVQVVCTLLRLGAWAAAARGRERRLVLRCSWALLGPPAKRCRCCCCCSPHYTLKLGIVWHSVLELDSLWHSVSEPCTDCGICAGGHSPRGAAAGAAIWHTTLDLMGGEFADMSAALRTSYTGYRPDIMGHDKGSKDQPSPSADTPQQPESKPDEPGAQP